MTQRLFLIASLCFAALTLTARFCYWRVLPDESHPFGVAASAAADLLLPLSLLLFASFRKSRLLAVLAVLSAFVVLVVDAANVVLFYNMREPFSFQSVHLLLLHADHGTMRLELGDYYYIVYPMAILVIQAFVIALAVLAAKIVRNPAHANLFRVGACCILLCSIASSLYCLSPVVGRPGRAEADLLLTKPAAAYVTDCLDAALSSRELKTYGMRCLSKESRRLLINEGLLPRDHAPRKIRQYKRIILIAVESLDLAYIGLRNPETGKSVTPFLDECREKHAFFTNFFTGSQPTAWGLCALLLSRFDYARDVLQSPKHHPSLFTELRKHGYYGAFFNGVRRTFMNQGVVFSALFDPDALFLREDVTARFPNPGLTEWGLDDETLFNAAFTVIRETADRPGFYFISTMDTHPPYACSDPDLRTLTKSPFLNSLAGLDRNLERFVKRLDRNGLYDDDTLIVITADHSATHGENYTKRAVFDPDRIALIFLSKSGDLKHVLPTNRWCSQLDLPVTLLAMLGFESPDSFLGSNIMTKRDCALSRSTARMYLRRPGRPVVFWDLLKDPETPLQRALYEWTETEYAYRR